MTVLFAGLITKSDCDWEIAIKMKKLADIRMRLKRDNTPAVRSGLKGEEHSLTSDIEAIKRYKQKLKK